MTTQIISLWTPNLLFFNKLFSASKVLPLKSINRGKMLILLSLLEPGQKAEHSFVSKPSLLDLALGIDTVQYLKHFQALGLLDMKLEEGRQVSFKLQGSVTRGQYFNYFVSDDIREVHTNLMNHIYKRPNYKPSHRFKEWQLLPFHFLTVAAL
jgi:hypothetical protein